MKQNCNKILKYRTQNIHFKSKRKKVLRIIKMFKYKNFINYSIV